MKKYLLFLISLILPPSHTMSHAAEIRFVEMGNEVANIYLSGPIEQGDNEKLIRLVHSQPVTFMRSNGVILSSIGGSVPEAFEISKTIRKLGLYTFVGTPINQFDHRVCASACVFIWLSGVVRHAQNGGRLVAHRPYVSVRSVTADNFSEANDATERALLDARQFLVMQKVPSDIIDRMLSLPSNDGYTLTAADLERIGIMSPLMEELAIAYCGGISNSNWYVADRGRFTLCTHTHVNTIRSGYIRSVFGEGKSVEIFNEYNASVRRRNRTTPEALGDSFSQGNSQ